MVEALTERKKQMIAINRIVHGNDGVTVEMERELWRRKAKTGVPIWIQLQNILGKELIAGYKELGSEYKE